MVRFSREAFTSVNRWDIAKAIPSPGPLRECSVDCLLYSLLIVNPTDAAGVVSVSDGQDTPIYLVPPVSVPPGGWISFTDQHGYFLLRGLQWAASIPGLHGRGLLVIV